MPSVLLSGPAAEPLSLTEAKQFVRVEHNDDDELIAALILAARVHVERATRRVLITQDWRIVRDAWPVDGRVPVLPAPVQLAIAARVYRSDGTTVSLDLSSVTADVAAAPAILDFSLAAVPAPQRATAGIEIDVRAGYGDAAGDLPEPLRQAIRLLLAHWYEKRGIVEAGATGGAPASVDALIAPYRVLGL